MTATYRTILTAAGIALEAAAAAAGTVINLTEMAVGDGNGNPTTPAETDVALVREVYRTTLNAIAQDPTDPTKWTAEIVIPAESGGFTIREAGLFNADGVLFAVANTPQVYKPTMAEGAYGDSVIRMVFTTANADTVNLAVDTSISVATRTWVMNYAIPANIFPGGLTSQLLGKASNADGDWTWIDPDGGITVLVDTIEENQTLAASQTVVTLATVTTSGLGVFIEGTRLRDDEWTATDATHITLATSYPDGTKITLLQNEQTGAADFARNGANVGTGTGTVFKDRVASDLRFKTIKAGTGVSITNNADDITISATGTGEANTASNLGTGTGVYASKSGVDLRFKSLKAGTGVSLSSDASSITITATGGGSSEATTASNVGTGSGKVFKQLSGTDLQFKSIKAGTGVIVTNGVDDVTVTATGEANTISSVGTGEGILYGKTGVDLQFKSIKAGTGISVTGNAFDVTVGVSGVAMLTGATFTGAVNAPSFNTTSSRRYKRDIASISPEDALQLVAGLRIVEYRMRADGSRAAGVIAEELADGPLDFCVVRTAGGEPEAVNYQPLFALAVAALQGLAARVEALESR